MSKKVLGTSKPTTRTRSTLRKGQIVRVRNDQLTLAKTDKWYRDRYFKLGTRSKRPENLAEWGELDWDDDRRPKMTVVRVFMDHGFEMVEVEHEAGGKYTLFTTEVEKVKK